MNYNKSVKSTFLMAFLTLTYFSTNAQSSYFGISTGYSVPTKSSDASGTFNTLSNFETYNFEHVNTGYGGGLNFAAKFGIRISDFVAFEIGANYLLGNSSTTTYREVSNGYTYEEIYTYSSNMLQLSPSIVLSPNNVEASINPYTRFGFIAGFGSIIQTYEEEQTNSNKEIITSELNGGMALGVNAAIGANFKLSEKVALFGEFNLRSLSYAPKKETITTYSNGGVDILPSLTVNEKEFELIEKIVMDFNQPENEPSKKLAVHKGYSSLALNIGIKVNLN